MHVFQQLMEWSPVARRVFYSFHYNSDNWRVQQVSKMGVLSGQPVLTSQKWEEVKKGGDPAVKAWIDAEMNGKSCLVVLIGSKTAGRKWVKHEIKKAWNDKRGVVGVYIHNLEDRLGNQSVKGRNPFEDLTVTTNASGSRVMSTVVTAYSSPYSVSTNVYRDLEAYLPDLVEAAITLRATYP